MEAGEGERNRLSISRDDGGFVVRERDGVPVTAGESCAQVSPDSVRCPLTAGAGHTTVFVNARDEGDVVVLGPLPGVEYAEVLAGPGNDVVAGFEGEDLIEGQGGTDWLAGRDGPDRIDGGPGDDLLDGGPGRDLVTYGTRRKAVHVDLVLGSGGTEGEVDTLRGFEDVTGGHGNDRLFGDEGPNLLYGGLDGRDLGDGRGGADQVSLRRAIGGPGDDRIDAKFADCGPGEDMATRLRFQPGRGYGPGCEQIVGYFYVITRPERVRGGVRFGLSCPIRYCAGRFTLFDARGVLARKRYRRRGEGFGGKGLVPLTLKFDRRPRSGRVRLRIVGRSLARDAFMISVRR